MYHGSQVDFSVLQSSFSGSWAIARLLGASGVTLNNISILTLYRSKTSRKPRAYLCDCTALSPGDWITETIHAYGVWLAGGCVEIDSKKKICQFNRMENIVS